MPLDAHLQNQVVNEGAERSGLPKWAQEERLSKDAAGATETLARFLSGSPDREPGASSLCRGVGHGAGVRPSGTLLVSLREDGRVSLFVGRRRRGRCCPLEWVGQLDPKPVPSSPGSQTRRCSQHLPLPPAPSPTPSTSPAPSTLLLFPAPPTAKPCNTDSGVKQLRHPKPLELVDLSTTVGNILPLTSQLALELQPLVFIWGEGWERAAGSSPPGQTGIRSPAGMGRHLLTMRLRTAVTRNIQAVPSTHLHVISDPVSVQEAPLGDGWCPVLFMGCKSFHSVIRTRD